MAIRKSTRIYACRPVAGERFGRLVPIRVIGDAPKAKGSRWLCRCDCGAKCEVARAYLLNGHVKSCGCLKLESATSHGMSKASEFHAWQGMRMRCHNPSDKSYPNYGGRGIFVCDRWRESFEVFYADMGPRPSSRHSLDRVENDGPYSPENCRWATAGEQARNRRTSRRYEYNGQSLILADWAKTLGFSVDVLNARIRSGWPIEKAFTEPLMWRGPRSSRVPRPGSED